jgi:hypothetical protein
MKTTPNPSAVERLPQIVQWLETSDHGPGEGACPHCGARGRWIVSFRAEDGTTRAAMRGCLKRYPISFIAAEHMRLSEKQAKYRKSGWPLNRADARALADCEAFYVGALSKEACEASLRFAKNISARKWRR